MARLLSVNVSLPMEVEYQGKKFQTGIYKEPIAGPVQASRLNLDGDGQADLVGHGGEQRAVHVYSFDNYSYWQTELGREEFPYGQFGENFTVTELADQNVHVGDRFQIGTAQFEVTQPRVPCQKLAMKMDSPGFVKLIMKSGRLGFYFRVLQEGKVDTGDDIECVHRHPIQMSITEIHELMYFDKQNLTDIERALQIDALSPGWRESFEDRLSKSN